MPCCFPISRAGTDTSDETIMEKNGYMLILDCLVHRQVNCDKPVFFCGYQYSSSFCNWTTILVIHGRRELFCSEFQRSQPGFRFSCGFGCSRDWENPGRSKCIQQREAEERKRSKELVHFQWQICQRLKVPSLKGFTAFQPCNPRKHLLTYGPGLQETGDQSHSKINLSMENCACHRETVHHILMAVGDGWWV